MRPEIGSLTKLEGEERWIRGGIRARRARNESRVRELMQGYRFTKHAEP